MIPHLNAFQEKYHKRLDRWTSIFFKNTNLSRHFVFQTGNLRIVVDWLQKNNDTLVHNSKVLLIKTHLRRKGFSSRFNDF
jgi:hypothetical protein